MYYNNRGSAYSSMGECDKAIADFTEAIRLDPKYALAYFNRACDHGSKGELDKTIADYTDAIRLDVKDAARAYNNRGGAYMRTG